MACSENIKDLLPDYHLEQLSPEEAETVRRHLEEDEECREELREISGVLDLMPLALEPASPPAHLKARVLDRVRQDTAPQEQPEEPPAAAPAVTEVLNPESSGRDFYRRTLPALAAAATLLVALVGLGWAYLGLQQENRELQAEVQQLQEDVRGLAEGNPGGELLTVPVEGTGEAPGARGTAVVDPSTGNLALDVYNLPDAPEGHSYRAWLVSPGGQNLSLGPMQLDDRGDGRMTGAVSESLDNYESLALTIEPEGAEELTGPTYLRASL